MSNVEYSLTQEITLPSRGLLNPEIPEGKLTQRCMMIHDQKVLAGGNREASSALQDLLQRTTVSPEGFDASNLTLADTVYMLFKLRILSYGNNFRFRAKCPECRKKIELDVDLSELPVETLEDDYEDSLTVTLPHRGDTVYLKVLSNKDIEDLNREVKRRKKRSPEDESEYILRIAYSIKKVRLVDKKEDITSLVEIERYLGTLTGLDASTILEARDNVSYGIVASTEQICPECHNYIDVPLQFSGDFFRPTPSR